MLLPNIYDFGLFTFYEICFQKNQIEFYVARSSADEWEATIRGHPDGFIFQNE